MDGDALERAHKAVALLIAVVTLGWLAAELGRGSEAQIARARLRSWWQRVSHCEECQRRREFLRDRGRVLWEAMSIVEQGQ